jgi:acyl-CoA synthetase (AMP-forming)/AMP-acid ligase II
VHAEIVLRSGESVEIEELRQFLARRLSDNDTPRTIGVAPSLPVTPVGKVLRRTVRDACRGRTGGT